MMLFPVIILTLHLTCYSKINCFSFYILEKSYVIYIKPILRLIELVLHMQ